MKSFVNSKSIPLLVLLSSLLAVLLRIWTRGNGPDAEGLFAPKPFAWVLLCLLTLAVIGVVWFVLRRLKNPGTYQDNYPKSPVAALCMLPAAVCFVLSGYTQLRNAVALVLPGTTVVDIVTGVFGLVAGVCLVLSALYRYMGKKPFFLIDGIIALYLAVRLFHCCQLWSNEPQVGLVVFPFLASMGLMLAAYHRVCFDVDLGKRNWAGFWSLLSVYFCAVAIFSFEEPIFYAACALWRAADLCSLRPLKRKKPRVETPPEATE